ncbi:MBL fold metallo-hydrolase [[Clostridium] innocuum]|nr:MBL fold metallo-hydrolase [[Clostridium] innocuum]MCR0575387.1 MBL fold metallo-hydrolase [[Clostridium] innocuum]
MLDIKYLDHAGFLIETDHHVLIFDFSTGRLPSIPSEKSVYVFISHCADDHFNKNIFHLATKVNDIRYYVPAASVNSKKSLRFFFHHVIEKKTREAITFIKPDQAYHSKGVSFKTLHSSDADHGVAYLVQTDGYNIFHAGHLHMWTWPLEETHINKRAEIAYTEQILKLRKIHIHVAFLLLDPRQENMYADGFDYFMKHINVDEVYPMHFNHQEKIIDFLLQDSKSESYRKKIRHTCDYI